MKPIDAAKEYCLKHGFKLIRVEDQHVISKRPDGSIDMATLNLEPTMTQQQFKDQCDVNLIMDSYVKTGEITHLARKQGVYADVSQIPDYHTALNQVIAADAAFLTLDARVRTRFDNDPAKLISFLNDSKNYDEALKLGLIEKPHKHNPNPPLPPNITPPTTPSTPPQK